MRVGLVGKKLNKRSSADPERSSKLLIFFLGVAAACTLLVAPFELVVAPSLACSAADAVLGSYILVIASVLHMPDLIGALLGIWNRKTIFLFWSSWGVHSCKSLEKIWWLS